MKNSILFFSLNICHYLVVLYFLSQCISFEVLMHSLEGDVFKCPIPSIQRVDCAAGLDRVEFFEDMAAIEVPVSALDSLPFKNDSRGDSVRLDNVMRAIRRDGYNNAEPIIVRLGRRGRWVVVDGGHRLTAARRVSRELLTNLFRR